jgi:recombinational DNA repair protein RecT
MFETTDPSKITHAYAVAYFKDGSVQFDVMRKDQIDAIRARAPGANSGPWSTDYAEMGRKTVVRRLMKSLPLTSETQAAVQRDIDREVSVTPVPALPSRTAQLRKELAAKVGLPATDAPGDDEDAEAPTDAAVTEKSADEQTEDATVVCGNVAGPGPLEGTVCLEPAGHAHQHKALSGSWPA